MTVLEAEVAAALNPGARDRGYGAALEIIRAAAGTERISLHATFERPGYFSVVSSAGESILATGTELPIGTSTQVAVPAGGQVFRQGEFGQGAVFERALDHLVMQMGYRSGCSIPLSVGNRTLAALCVTARAPQLCDERVLDVLMQASSPLTMALLAERSASATRILVCHSDELVGEGIARILEHSLAATVDVVTTPEEAIGRATGRQRRIDKIVLGGFFADGNLDGFLRDLRAAGARAPTLVIDPDASPVSEHLAVLGGADGYIGQDAGSAEIVRGLHALDAGGPPPARGRSGEQPRRQQEHLTAQECRLLLLLERGIRFKDIAAEMEICESTAKGYARNVFTKLGVHSRGEAVHEAQRQGILRLLHAGAHRVPVIARH
ncbi:MAG TPA: LuxR C-terminal-related transcriptional regulator [Pseudonocardia sp.]|jgi:DNA-binding NarL/FixJ family response regulator|nr:LuxR C-terminal-related transcriptional regulator [Pseudonocardia sp.]